MKDRLWNIIAAVIGFALFAFAIFAGCRALRNNPSLWLCMALVFMPGSASAPQSPRGQETFGGRASVPLAWNASVGAGGYRVYYRRVGENYTRSQDAGTNLSLRVTGLERKTTYSFVATAYLNDYESGPSNEVIYRTAFAPSWR